MIIDQLPSLPSVQDTDEVAIERGTTTYKTPVSTLASNFASDSSPLSDGTASAGSSAQFSRGDHVHPLNVATTGTPEMDGTGSRGSASTYARFDHVHPSDTNKQDVLTFDNAPTQDSANPVKSGGVFSAIADSMILGQMVSDYIPSTSDLNNYTTPGFYRTGGTIPAHAPTGTTYNILWVLIVGTTRLQFLMSSGAIYARTGNSTTWFAWYKFTGSQT